MPTPHVVIIDGHNFLHRARAGFTEGEFAVVFNFFRNLRALIEKLSPSRVIFCLEGHPQKRYDALPEYKANRKIDADSEDPKVQKKRVELQSFFRQANLCKALLAAHFPVSVVRHADYECDDVIYNLIRRSSAAVPWTVVSNDTDFTQLLNEFEHVKVYNPMKKEYVVKPDYDYVVWKALRGDGSDNISGLLGIGDKTADAIVNDPERLATLFENTELAEHFQRNYDLIKFQTWSDNVANEMTSTVPVRDWDAVSRAFEGWGFKSMLKESTWDKFRSTFDPLFPQT